MCSLGARLLQGETSSSICGSTMIHNITNTSKGASAEQVVGGSLATALRDRQAYVIPIQPNRSLPVRPAPHHTPSRATIVKSALGRSSKSIITSVIHSESLVIDTPESIGSSSVEDNIAKSKKDEYNNKEDTKMERSVNNQNAVTTSDFIDISRSPDRIDLSDEISICPSRLDSSSPGCWVHGSVVPKEKRKRRRRRVKRLLDDGDVSAGNTEIGKTVPPLRLKKIQTLQEPRVASGNSAWQGIGREINDGSFNVEADFMREDISDFGHGSNKYRIVSGHTPPYEERIDSSSEPRLDSLDAAKLRYRQTKLKLKLRELRRKTVELGKEMLRTVFTSSNGPRGSRLRQTMNRYEGQIKHLEKLLNELPKVAYAGENIHSDWNTYQEGDKVNLAENFEHRRIISPARTICSSNSSSMCSSPSLEPPKLSPRSPTNYEAARSPSDVRNSPPVLPRVYVTIADCTDDWNERYSRRARNKRTRNRSPLLKQAESIAGPSSPVISTTTETIIHDKIELVQDDDNNFKDKSFFDIAKSDLEILEVYEEPEVHKNLLIKTNACEKNQEDIKPIVKCLTSPQPIVINTTSVDNDYETKPLILREINEATTTQDNVASQPITSSCEIVDNLKERREEKAEETKDEIVTVREDAVLETPSNTANGIGIAQQFPTLGNWIARLSKKQVPNIETSNKLPDATQIEERPSAFQSSARGIVTTSQVLSSDAGKSARPEIPRAPAVRPIVEETVNVAPQWRADRWQDQQGQTTQPQTLPQSYGPALPLPPPPPPPSLSQEFCSPNITMARLYTRNYAIDPYSVAYGYNPAIAAAAATASLWNSAAILQYPLMRPSSSLLNSQQARIPPGTLQFPSSAQPLQRPNYRVSLMQQNDGKRPDNSMNYTRDGKHLSSGYSTTFEQAKRATAEYHHAVAAAGQNRGISCNSLNGQTINYRNCLQQQQQQQQQQTQEQHHHQQQQQQQQQQFARTNYSENSMRLPVPGVPSWRTGHVLSAMGNDYNYGATSPWTSGASGNNILNTIARNSTPFVSSSTLTINSSRARNTKDSADTNVRNCETPHLGKVNYSPNTVSNLECSNCGLGGSMFKCLGCEVAFYCDENCQARHWSRHVISCPKKMPKLKKLVH